MQNAHQPRGRWDVIRPRTGSLINAVPTALLIGAVALTSACVDANPNAPDESVHRSAPRAPAFAISDGAHGGSTRLYFLPPLVSAPTFSGTFDPSAFTFGSHDEVSVCQVVGLTCGTIVSFGPGDVHMDPVAESYTVIWQTRSANLIPGVFYRIEVKVRGETLGYAGVVVLANGAGRQAVSSNDFVVIIAGTAVPIQFRLQVGPPTSVPSSRSTVTAKGDRLMCGLSGTSAYCWGFNNLGQLGDGTTLGAGPFTAQKPPVGVTGGLAFASIEAGGNHTCGLTTAGAAYCWGQNLYGELGSDQVAPGPLQRIAFPTAVSGGLTFGAITVGSIHSCGLTADGDAYCWGSNGEGQLGDGTNTDRITPVAVAGGHHFTTITAGAVHTCGIDVNQFTYCWGSNVFGQSGSTGAANSPRGIVTPAFASISAGAWHTCGLQSTGQAFCWGFNLSGQLGNGTFVDSPSPVAVTPIPNVVFTAISAGFSHSCGLVTGGAAYCWGADAFGELGDANFSGPNFAAKKPTPQPVSNGLTFSEISAGWTNTCGRTTGSAVYCWGASVSWSPFSLSFGESRVPLLISFP